MENIVDWSQAPKNARWWAMDANGEAHWFVTPDVKPFTNFWYSEPIPAPAVGFQGDCVKASLNGPTRKGQFDQRANSQQFDSIADFQCA